MLREILSQPQGPGEETGDGRGLNDERHGSVDSGYFSRKGSKAVSTDASKRDAIYVEEMGELGERFGQQNRQDADEQAEEADDEGAGLEDLDDEETGGAKQQGMNVKGDIKDQARKRDIPHPTSHTETALPLEHTNQTYPQTRMGTRFISPRRPAEARVSADEATVAARPRFLGLGK